MKKGFQDRTCSYLHTTVYPDSVAFEPGELRAYYKLCKSDFSIAANGKIGFKCHIGTKKHIVHSYIFLLFYYQKTMWQALCVRSQNSKKV